MVFVIKLFNKKGMVAVGKMNAGSGGTGIEFFPSTVYAKLNNQTKTVRLGSRSGISFHREIGSNEIHILGEER